MNVVANNIPGMFSQRQLGITNSNKAKSTEKLSSGYRINRAADDAAGLTISEKMRRQIRGLTQGTKNALDGVSMCQIADGALEEVSDMLHRLTELSVKSSNGTNSAEDRQAIQDEVSELLQEINRVSDTTEFNEQRIFANTKDISEAIINKPDSELTEEEKTYKRRQAIQKSFSLSGTSSSSMPSQSIVYAKDNGLDINGTTIRYSDIKNAEGKSVEDIPLESGSYSFSYSDMTFSFNVPDEADLSDITAAINGTKLGVDVGTERITPIEFSDVQMNDGANLVELLGVTEAGQMIASIKPTSDGIYIMNGKVGDKTIPWTDLGINDLSEAAGKSFSITDDMTCLSFTCTISSDVSEEELQRTHNTVISTVNRGNYCETIPGQYARGMYLGGNIKNATIEQTISVTDGSNSGEVKILGIESYLTHGQEWFLMGHHPLEQLSGMDITVELRNDGEGKPIARITDKNTGDYIDQSMTYIDNDSLGTNSSRSYVIFGSPTGSGGTGAYIKVAIEKPSNISLKQTDNSIGQNALINGLGTIGTIATNIHVNGALYLQTQNGIAYRYGYRADGVIPGELDLPSDTESQSEEDNGSQSISGKNSFWIQSGAEPDDGIMLEFGAMDTKVLGISDLNTSTQIGAQRAIEKVKDAQSYVSALRSNIGAQQNRLEHTIKNQNNIVENTQTAESRIRDTDMADEMVKYSKENILQQVGQSMLAQSNQSRQGLLNLLQ